MLTSRKPHCAIQELCTTLGFPCISLQFQTCHGCQLLKHFQRHHLLLKPTGQESEKTKSVRLIRPCARYVLRRCFCALLTWIWEMKSVSTSRPFTCNHRFAIQQLCQIKVPQTTMLIQIFYLTLASYYTAECQALYTLFSGTMQWTTEYLSIALCILQQAKQECGWFHWPPSLSIGVAWLSLCSATDPTTKPTKGDSLLVSKHILQVLLGLR